MGKQFYPEKAIEMVNKSTIYKFIANITLKLKYNLNKSSDSKPCLIVPTIWKMRNIVFGCCVLVFFHAKSAATNNHRRELDILKPPFSRDSNEIWKFQKFFPSVKKNRFENFDF